MKIESVRSYRFSNALHVQLAVGLKDIIGKYDPERLRILPQYEQFTMWVERENICYKYILRSHYARQKAAIDQLRDNDLNGIRQGVELGLRHSISDIATAARRLKTLLDTLDYSKHTRKLPHDAETITVARLLEELTSRLTNEIELLRLQPWVEQLDIHNQEYEALVRESHSENSEPPEWKMKEARNEVELSFQEIADCVNAYMLTKDEALYAPLVKEVNAQLEQCENIFILHASGRR